MRLAFPFGHGFMSCAVAHVACIILPWASLAMSYCMLANGRTAPYYTTSLALGHPCAYLIKCCESTSSSVLVVEFASDLLTARTVFVVKLLFVQPCLVTTDTLVINMATWCATGG
jgi:hypothetical protein